MDHCNNCIRKFFCNENCFELQQQKMQTRLTCGTIYQFVEVGNIKRWREDQHTLERTQRTFNRCIFLKQ